MGPDSYKIGDVVHITIGGHDAIPVTIDSIEVCCDPLVLSTVHVLCHQNFWDEKQSKSDHEAIKKVIYNPPATIIFWADGTKTVVKCMEGDEFDPEKGLAIGIAQKFVSKKEIKKWLPKNWELPEEEIPDLTGLSWKTEFFDEMGSKTKFDLTASTQIKEDDEDKKPSFLGNAIRDLTDIFKGAVKGE